MRLAVLFALAACGTSPASPVDSAPPDDASDAPMPPGCDYAEQRDLTNDDVPPATGTPEDTGLTHATRTVLCGTFDDTHFDGDITVDVDGYLVTFAEEADLLVRIHGAGAESIELVGIDIYGGPAFDELAGQVTFYGDHGVAAVRLPAGTYELAAFALATAAIAAPVPYRIEVASDAPATRCPSLASGGYAEAGDGADSTGNDVVTIPSGAPPGPTPGADVAEPTQLVLAPDALARIAGTAADVAIVDQYEDKDTFEVTTAADTNELAIHLEWTGAANLDALVFEQNTFEPIVRAIAESNTGPETKTFSVKPSTAYWVLVGAKVGSAVPRAYSATLCGARFTP